MCSRAQFHKAHTQQTQRDQGMTLVELLMTVTILGIIMTSLSAAMIVILRTERPIKDHLSESKDICPNFRTTRQKSKRYLAAQPID